MKISISNNYFNHLELLYNQLLPFKNNYLFYSSEMKTCDYINLINYSQHIL